VANLKDVAKHAGVGVSTASRVLRGEGYASDAVRAKVLRAAEELNYIPNLLAQSMRGRPTRAIGFLVYDVVNPFFANVTAGVEDAAHDSGFNVVVCSSRPWQSSAREESYMQMLVQRQIDGLVLQHVFSSPDYAALLERHGIPAVRVLNPQPGYPYDLVRCDTRPATSALIRHLYLLGHRRIAALGPQMPSYQGSDRLAGFNAGLADAGLVADERLIRLEGWRTRDGYTMTHHLVERNPPDAIFAFGPRLAVGAACALRERGLRVPDDIALVCIDDFGIGSDLDPFMTVIRQPEHEMGRQVTELLIERILGSYSGSPREIVLPAQLVIRRSCGAPLPQNRTDTPPADAAPFPNAVTHRWDDD
jgi:LacI family transcriptional regulator